MQPIDDSADLLRRSVDATLELVPGFDPEVIQVKNYSKFDLPLPSGADYRFSVYCYPGGEPQITASLLSDPSSYFWYYAFEIDDFGSSADQEQTFLSELVRLTQSATAIEERQGLLWHSFTCYLEAAERTVFGTRPSRLNLAFKRYVRTHRSKAIAPP